MLKIRLATKEDAKRIREIYSYYVNETAITFDYDVPSINYFEDSIEKINNEFSYLVLEDDNNIIGYSYAVMYKPRLAYRHSVEVTIYLDKDEKGHGYEMKSKPRDPKETIFNPLFLAIFNDSMICGIYINPVTKLILLAPSSCNISIFSANSFIVISSPFPS